MLTPEEMSAGWSRLEHEQPRSRRISVFRVANLKFQTQYANRLNISYRLHNSQTFTICIWDRKVKDVPKIFANLKNISDETSKSSHFSSIGSIVANSKIKIITIGLGNVVGPLETRSGAIQDPYLFFPTEIKYQL